MNKCIRRFMMCIGGVLILILIHQMRVLIIKRNTTHVEGKEDSINSIRLAEKSAFHIEHLEEYPELNKEKPSLEGLDLEAILLNATMIGCPQKETFLKLSERDSFYEEDFSDGQYWVQKSASKLNPTLYALRLYEQDDVCYVVLRYAIDKKRNAYEVVYRYKYIEVATLKEYINRYIAN